MLDLFDKLSDVTIKASRDIITIFIFGLLVIGSLFGNVGVLSNNIFINKILLACFINYILSYILSHYIIKTTNIGSKIRVLLPIFAIFFALGSIFLFASNFAFGFNIGFFILYLVIWSKGIRAISSDEDIHSIRNKFVLNIIIISMLILMNYIFQNHVFVQKITGVYLPIYLVISVLYLIHSSLTKAYSGKNKNTINMTRNVRLFNILSTLLTFVIFVLVVTNFFGAGDIKIVSELIGFVLKIIEKILSIVFYPIILLLAKLAEMISKKPDRYSKLIDNNLNEANQQIDSRIKGVISIENPIIDSALNIFKWVVFAIIVFYIVYFILKKIKESYAYEAEMSEEGEEKDFIFSIKDVKETINKRMKSLQKRMKKIINKDNNDLSSLHVIRRMYIDVILKLSKKGYPFRRYNTPNEFLSNIDDKRYINAGIHKLTQYYNDVRYGHKEMKKASIDECINIKESIDKIE